MTTNWSIEREQYGVCSTCIDGKCIECEYYDHIRFLNYPEDYHYTDDGDLAWAGCTLATLSMAGVIAALVFLAKVLMW